jgi:hypothetical protein
MECGRLWGRGPDWAAELPREEQARLLAWYRVHQAPDGKPLEVPALPVEADEDSDEARALREWQLVDAWQPPGAT